MEAVHQTYFYRPVQRPKLIKPIIEYSRGIWELTSRGTEHYQKKSIIKKTAICQNAGFMGDSKSG
tara:strand:+ start:184 stop:378 length:195 start_codon:yes stop_codon:yes gene_type:complete